MLRFAAGDVEQYRLYDPRVFVALRDLFRGIEADPDRDCQAILSEAGHIHASLEDYLRLSHFARDWRLIRDNCRDPGQLHRQFHVWFNGLKTLRLVRHLSQDAFPPVSMFDGLGELIDLIGGACPTIPPHNGIPAIEDQYSILVALRSAFPLS
jgi:hypothetical protein